MNKPDQREQKFLAVPKWLLIAVCIFCVFSSLSIPAEEEPVYKKWKSKNDLLKIQAVKSEKAKSSLLLDIAKNKDRLVCVGQKGHVLFSDDGGRSWNQGEVPVRVTLTAVHFPTPKHGWAVGHDGVVLHTEDGGKTWVKQMDGFKGNKLNLVHARRLVKDKKDELARVSKNSKDSIREELNDLKYEVEYFRAAKENCCVPLLDVWFKNKREGFVIGAYGRIFHTSDGGKNWTPWWDRIENPTKRHLYGFAATDKALFIAGESGRLYRSFDEGERWHTLSSPYDGSYFGILASGSNNFVIAFGIGAKMALSRDLGETWKLVNTKAGASLSGGCLRKDGSALVASYSGIILSVSGETGEFSPQKKIGAGWNSLIETEDGHIILSGLYGILRSPLKNAEEG